MDVEVFLFILFVDIWMLFPKPESSLLVVVCVYKFCFRK